MRRTRLRSWLPPLALAAATLGLIAHARAFDFVCDDAFITLRYARNLATLGQPVYNVGERVEGYTNFLWMVMAALGLRTGLGEEATVLALGSLAGAGVLAATWLLWRRIEPSRPWGGAVVLLALACSAPLAAWTLSGLETPLFTAFVALSIAWASEAAADGDRKGAALAGMAIALASLTRPEGLLVGAIALGMLAIAWVGRPRIALTTLASAVGACLAILLPFFVWRWRYYGDLLPDTFYLKTSGDALALRKRGANYVTFAAEDLGYLFVAIAALSLAVPARRAAAPPADLAEYHARATALRIIRATIVSFVTYVVLVGGDFLALYRFLVPMLPLALLAVAAATCRALALLPPRARPAAGLVASLVLAGSYGAHQLAWSSRVRASHGAERSAAGIEPLWWTRLYARRWAAMGRWIAQRAQPSDAMAVGAAGAMPYFARIYNLDLLGLCDRYIARHGDIVGDRPGHQRRSPRAYTLSKRVTFLFDGDSDADRPRPLGRDPYWESLGYVWAEAEVDPVRHGAPNTFFFQFLLRRDRALALAQDPFLRTSLGTGPHGP